MKKYLIIGVLVLFAFAIVYKSFFSESSSSTEFSASIDFNGNIASKMGDKIPLKINVNSGDIKKLEIVYNDSVLKEWENPAEGQLNLIFDAGFFGVGTKKLVLRSTLENGSKEEDEKMVRVLSDLVPQFWKAKISETLPHNTSNFTQGLEFDGNQLFESTGQKGESKVAKMNLANAQIIDYNSLDANYFGEGITILGNKIYQITWQEHKCFVYDKVSLKLIKEFSYTGEGWGLCNDGKSIIMSDGSERLTYRNPEDFTIQKVVEVFDNKGPITNLNELEYVDGKIYANIWMTNAILVIGANTGKVEAIIDGTDLENSGRGTSGDVLNGIAYNKLNKKIYVTGKRWEKMFAITFDKPGL